MRRFEALDAMRGIAAMIVVLHHAEWQLLRPHFFQAGYLAVDFFFMLSGFVLAHTYERLFAHGLTPPSFMWCRIRRLWPVMAAGIIFGTAVAFSGGMPKEVLILRVIAQLLFIPVIMGTLGLYVLDGVQWSLLFELFANAVHGVFFRGLRARWLAILTLIFFIVLAATAYWNDSVGVGDRGMNIIGGVPRVLFSYTAGVLLFRMRSRGLFLQVRVSGVLVVAALPVTLVLAGLIRAAIPSWLVDLCVVAIVIPLLVAAGSAVNLPHHLRSVAAVLGALSYPLYAVHVPAIGVILALELNGSFAAALAVLLALAAAVALAAVLEPGGREVFAIGSRANRGDVALAGTD